jgi:hypothetical protein
LEVDIKPVVFLLDVDGVLLKPYGYRASFRATINYLTQRMKLGDLAPDEEVNFLCESLGITNEWDMTALSLACLFDAILDGNHQGFHLPGDVLQACDAISENKFTIPTEVDYRRVIQKVGANYQTGLAPAEIALILNQNPNHPALFPNLMDHPILENLLGCTRDVFNCTATRIFQNFTLGSEEFRNTYQIPACFDTPSLLLTMDRRLISDEMRDRLLLLWRRRDLALVAYTARPSLPPRGVNPSRVGYAPEAEFALKVLEVEEIPLVAYGRLQYAADLDGLPIDALVKPSPVQAIGAILAALGMNEDEAMHTAIGIAQEAGLPLVAGASRRLPVPRDLLPVDPIQVHVFEDAPSGFRAGKLAVEMLNQVGITSTLHCWGVTQSQVKQVALKVDAEKVFEHIDQALDYVLDAIGLPIKRIN